MTMMRFEFGDIARNMDERTLTTKQGDTVSWTLPHAELPLLLNGIPVGYVEVHMHAAWAPDGVPDTSFGFTGRVNTEELRAAVLPPPPPPAGQI